MASSCDCLRINLVPFRHQQKPQLTKDDVAIRPVNNSELESIISLRWSLYKT